MTRMAVRRLLVSAALGMPLPLALFGGIVLQAEDRVMFHVLLPALLFGMMAFAIWTLMRRPAGH